LSFKRIVDDKDVVFCAKAVKAKKVVAHKNKSLFTAIRVAG
jgi:hypothetical protein